MAVASDLLQPAAVILMSNGGAEPHGRNLEPYNAHI